MPISNPIAAQAFVIGFGFPKSNGALIDLPVVICYSGDGINGGLPDTREILISAFDPNTSVVQQSQAIAAGIRANALSLGYDVGTNQITMATLSKA